MTRTSVARKRKRADHEEEHENHERWAVSYADMMTVLVGLFIVLYATSQVDEAKYAQLAASLRSAFGQSSQIIASVIPGNRGAMQDLNAEAVRPELATDIAFEFEDLPPVNEGIAEGERYLAEAEVEYTRLWQVAQAIATNLEAEGLGDRVNFRVTDRGLVVGLVADDVFFSPDTAHLTKKATDVIDNIAPVLARISEPISVEGHANVLPSNRYDSNWELSSDRATQVLRRLVERGGVPPERVSATGFGDAHPLGGDVDDLDANRRVDLVVISPVSEEVRALLPMLNEKNEMRNRR